MAVTERWTERSGPRIRYLDNAPDHPVGLPILFSPGLSDFADEYVEMLEFFLPRRVLVVEVRGRGKSDAPAAGYEAADHVGDLDAVLTEEAIDRFHLATFSRGTTWGLQLAIAAPGRVASVSLGDYQAAEIALDQDFVDRQLATRFRGKPMSARIPRHVLDRVAADSVGREMWDELGRMSSPLLVARAEGILDDTQIARYRSARPDVEVVTVPDSAHDLFRADRLFYPRAIAEFIARRCPGS